MQTTMATSYGGQSVWVIDPTHTNVAFSIDNFFFFKVKGGFVDVTGTLLLDEEDVRRSSVQVKIKGRSIKTSNKRRDAHLCAADFLDVIQYPDILFQSSQVKPGTDRDTITVVGELTVKGKSREVVLNVDAVDRSCSPQGEEVIYYSAMTELDRHDFGIKYGRGAIGRKLKVVINLQALKQA
jgi:polyisoprenoid-binding protein YceI